MVEEVVARLEFESPSVGIGRYRCRRQDPAPTDAGVIEHSYVSIPRGGVYVKHVEGGDDVLIDPRHAIFHNAGEVYRLSHPHGCGDHGSYLRISPRVLREAAVDLAPELEDEERPRFPRPQLAIDDRMYLQHRRLLGAALDPRADPLQLEEGLLVFLRGLLRRQYLDRDTPRGPRPQRRRTLEDQRARTRVAQAWLVAHHGQRVQLEQVAQAAETSVFHLCRVFRNHAGISIHKYLTSVRLRASLEPVLEGRMALTDIASSHGFSSHSHFTNLFHRAFGVTPSKLRGKTGRRLRPPTHGSEPQRP